MSSEKLLPTLVKTRFGIGVKHILSRQLDVTLLVNHFSELTGKVLDFTDLRRWVIKLHNDISISISGFMSRNINQPSRLIAVLLTSAYLEQ